MSRLYVRGAAPPGPGEVVARAGVLYFGLEGYCELFRVCVCVTRVFEF